MGTGGNLSPSSAGALQRDAEGITRNMAFEGDEGFLVRNGPKGLGPALLVGEIYAPGPLYAGPDVEFSVVKGDAQCVIIVYEKSAVYIFRAVRALKKNENTPIACLIAKVEPVIVIRHRLVLSLHATSSG